MPSSSINIYIDSSFFELSPGVEDVSVIFRTAEANNIGSFNVPIDVSFNEASQSINNIGIEYTTIPSVSGVISIYSEYNNIYTVMSGMEVSLVDYYTGDMGDIYVDLYTQYITGYLPISGSQNVYINFIGGNEYLGFESTFVNYWTYNPINYLLDINSLYTNFSGNYDYFGDPISFIEYNACYSSCYSRFPNISGAINKIVDITLSGWVIYDIPTSIYSTFLNTSSGILLDFLTISGGLLKNDLDITICLMDLGYFTNECMCSVVGVDPIDFNLSVISGSINYIDAEIKSTICDLGGIECDINLYSLKISNFSIDVGEYVVTDTFISVDVTDDVFNVVTSGTYFMLNGDIVPVTFSGINDGYRMFYNPEDAFTSISGAIEVLVHAENDNSNYLNQSYYLTYGYYLKYSNKGDNKTDLGFGKEIDVRVSAEDYASCPTNSVDAYYFYTKYFQSSDLFSSIFPLRNESLLSYNSDLYSSIYPVSTAYFYGKSFKVTVDAKDFSGNEMVTYEFEFVIEDPSN